MLIKVIRHKCKWSEVLHLLSDFTNNIKLFVIKRKQAVAKSILFMQSKGIVVGTSRRSNLGRVLSRFVPITKHDIFVKLLMQEFGPEPM